MPLFKAVAAGALALVLGILPVAAAERAIIILDGSGSMWAQIDGEARISIARETLDEVLEGIPDDLELGFMTYGHRTKGDCDDIEMLVEPAAGTAAAISEAAAAINPKGKTPISAAVKLAAEDLHFTEDKATVILITDGLETCEADPCALASDLESQGVDFTTHVVGFGLTEEEGHQVACLAENTGGKYFQASDADALAKALTETVAQVSEPEPEPAPAPEPAALDYNLDPEITLAEGMEPLHGDEASPVWAIYKPGKDGTLGEYVDTEYGVEYKGALEPGDYIVRAKLDYAYIDMPVTLTADTVAKPYFVMNVGHLTLRPLASEGAEPDPGAAVETRFNNGESTTNYGEVRMYVPAGDTEVNVTIGNGKLSETIAVAAGEEVTRDLIVGVGHVVFNAFYAGDLKVEEGGLTFNIVGAKKDIQGNRQDFGTAYGPDTKFDLPPGDYVALVSMDQAKQEIPFTVNAGEASAVDAELGAGVLAVTAPGADNIELFSPKADIQGNFKAFGNTYAEEANVTLPAGEYKIVVTLKTGGTKESTGTVTAGERTEVTVN